MKPKKKKTALDYFYWLLLSVGVLTILILMDIKGDIGCSKKPYKTFTEESDEKDFETESVSDDAILYKNVTCMDKNGFGIEAFRILTPKVWNVRYDIVWNINSLSTPLVECIIESGSGNEKVHIFPILSYKWYLSPYFKHLNKNSYYPMDPEDYIKDIVLSNVSKNISNLEIINKKRLSNTNRKYLNDTERLYNNSGSWSVKITGDNSATAQDLTSGTVYKLEIKSEEIKVRYKEGNKVYDEIFLISLFCFNPQNTYDAFADFDAGVITWGCNDLISLKTLSGELDNYNEVFNTIIRSFNFNNNWISMRDQLRNEIKKKKWNSIKAALNAISSRRSSTSADYSYDKDNSLDRIFDDWSEAILNTETYYNPINEEYYELPEDKYVWTNGDEYIFTESPGYDPNSDNAFNNLDWELMEAR